MLPVAVLVPVLRPELVQSADQLAGSGAGEAGQPWLGLKPHSEARSLYSSLPSS